MAKDTPRSAGTKITRETVVSRPVPSLQTRICKDAKDMHNEIYTRWTYPLVSLWDDSLVKGILAALGALFASDIQLILLVSILVIIDFITGVWAAHGRGEKVASWGFRQTGIKTVEYTVLLACTTMVANSFDVVEWLGTLAFLFVSLTELKSIMENLTDDDSAAGRVWVLLKKELSKREDVDVDNN